MNHPDPVVLHMMTGDALSDVGNWDGDPLDKWRVPQENAFILIHNVPIEGNEEDVWVRLRGEFA